MHSQLLYAFRSKAKLPSPSFELALGTAATIENRPQTTSGMSYLPTPCTLRFMFRERGMCQRVRYTETKKARPFGSGLRALQSVSLLVCLVRLMVTERQSCGRYSQHNVVERVRDSH